MTDDEPAEPPDPAAPTDSDVQPPDEDGHVPDAAFVEVDVGDVAGTPTAIAEGAAGRETAIVPKRTFCERCEYFAEPPTVACTNDGTEITEMVDTAHFRVVDCPVVARRRAIGDVSARSDDDA